MPIGEKGPTRSHPRHPQQQGEQGDLRTIPTKKYWATVTDFIATSRQKEVIEASGALPGQKRRTRISSARRTIKKPSIIRLHP